MNNDFFSGKVKGLVVASFAYSQRIAFAAFAQKFVHSLRITHLCKNHLFHQLPPSLDWMWEKKKKKKILGTEGGEFGIFVISIADEVGRHEFTEFQDVLDTIGHHGFDGMGQLRRAGTSRARLWGGYFDTSRSKVTFPPFVTG